MRSRSVEPCLPRKPVPSPKLNVLVGLSFASRERLLEAAEEENWPKASATIKDEFELFLIDQVTLDMALRVATMRRNGAIARLSISKGADVDTHLLKGFSTMDLLRKKELRKSCKFSLTLEPTPVLKSDTTALHYRKLRPLET